MSQFDGVMPALAEALSAKGYEALTQVQSAVLAPELEGEDLLVSAQTGSGKTVAFGLAIASFLLDDVSRFAASEGPLALVVAPTRELALQVRRELTWLYQKTGAVITSCVGGMDFRTEKRALERGAHIVVGTPGRLCDHIRRRSFDPASLGAVILDEADEMLDLGFREDLEFILEETPEDRRTLMFSATVPKAIAQLAKKYQHSAVRVTTAQEKKQHVDIEYRALTITPKEREHAIINVLRFYDAKNALIFCNTRAVVNHMVARFNNRGFSVVALSGELSQNERTHALQAMRDGRARVCIATDVAARGIDLPNLDLVVHADLPTNPETLLHRSGRTGRAGRKGVSVLIVDPKGRGRAERILRGAKINAEWGKPPSADEVHRRDEERLLSNPLLTESVTTDETEFIQKILALHSAEQIAAAFLRQSRSAQSAPEDLLEGEGYDDEPERFRKTRPGKKERELRKKRDTNPRDDRKSRTEFENAIWVSLSVGRKHHAEPRWLIPLICNGGDITKREIGSIKLQEEQTFVQLNADYADKFFAKLGPSRSLEKNIKVERLKGEPSFDTDLYKRDEGHAHYKSKSGAKKTTKPYGRNDTNKFNRNTVDGNDQIKRKPRKTDNKPVWSKEKTNSDYQNDKQELDSPKNSLEKPAKSGGKKKDKSIRLEDVSGENKGFKKSSKKKKPRGKKPVIKSGAKNKKKSKPSRAQRKSKK